MKVSIITVSLNSAVTIEACLRSITAQTHPDVEQISVDGRSVDGTLEILERNRDRFAARLVEPDGGVYRAMNKGLAPARGDLVGFLNSDDVYAADDVVAGLVALISHEELDSCYGDLVYGRGGAVGRERTVRYWRAGPFDVRNFEKG